MNFKLFSFFIALLIFSCTVLGQKAHKKEIKLRKSCSYENRKVVSSIKNKVAVLSTQNEFYILTIKDQKYIPCNLPAGIKNRSIIISGAILEIFPNERLMATPLRLTKAYIK